MKNASKLWIILGLILAVALCGCLDNDNNTAGDATDNTGGADFTKKAALSDNNTVLTFIFEENPTDDYFWMVAESSAGTLKKMNEFTDPSSTEGSGASETRTWIFEGARDGTTDVTFYYSGLRGVDRIIEEITYTIFVNTDKTMQILRISTPNSNSVGLYGKDVEVTDNSTVMTMAFVSNPTTGYSWKLTESENGILNVTFDYKSSANNMPGAPGVETWVFTGENAGTTTLTFEYLRSFEENSTIDSIVFTVVVGPDKTVRIMDVTI